MGTEFEAFPFKPYTIQLDLMRAIYAAIEKGGVGIFESPTGTGKTLSIICSALQWLVDQHSGLEREFSGCDKSDNNSQRNEPEWLQNFDTKQDAVKKKKHEERRKQRLLNRGKHVHIKHTTINHLTTFGSKSEDPEKQRSSNHVQNTKQNGEENEEFIIDDWDSDTGQSSEKKRKKISELAQSDSGSSHDEDEIGESDIEPLKVFFCSRTHSQLAQFIGEVKRTKFASSLQTVTIGSRKNLCINDAVLKLGSTARINEGCLELQKKKTAALKLNAGRDENRKKSTKKGSCPFLSKKSRQKMFQHELARLDPLDIEDLVKLGHKIGTCPYYGTRAAIPLADVVVLPYQSLLHTATRESLGVKLQDCVVVVDEAHNLVDTITSMYSCHVSASQVVAVHDLLSEYLDKFQSRLAAGNRRYIQLLLVLTKAFINYFSENGQEHENVPGGARTEQSRPPDVSSVKGNMLTINDFLFSLRIDNINLFKLDVYIRQSNIVHKVSSYGEKQAQVQADVILLDASKQQASAVSAFRAVIDFIMALTNADLDGRILVTSPNSAATDETPKESSFKFVMLNAATHFAQVVKEARAVVLAGGTLQPIQDMRDHLFPDLPPEKVHVFTCNHIVPAESILPMAIAKGPTGTSFDFTFHSRGSKHMMEELGRLVSNICSVVPQGIVCFFPSFVYKAKVVAAWTASGQMAVIETKKRVFQEPRNALQVETILQQYRDCILGNRGKSPRGRKDLPEQPRQNQQSLEGSDPVPEPTQSLGGCDQSVGSGGQSTTGALLLCVVGAKMSEGINFSDGMGRCVVMVGLPYPSPSDPEIVERMRYLDQCQLATAPPAYPLDQVQGAHDLEAHAGKRASSRTVGTPTRGREYYENLCFKAVNQSIGRAIRHINDYACILLVDARYTQGSRTSSTIPVDSRQQLGQLPAAGPAGKLPGWIRDCLVTDPGSFGQVQSRLRKFFKFNESKAASTSVA